MALARRSQIYALSGAEAPYGDIPFSYSIIFTKENIMPIATAQAAQKLLTPNDHTLIMIDHQSQMAFATRSIDLALLRNNAAVVAKAAFEFKVPTI